MGLVTIAAAPLCSAPSPAARPSAAAGRAALIMRRGVEPARAQGLRWSLRREATRWDGCCAAAGGRAFGVRLGLGVGSGLGLGSGLPKGQG